MTRNVWENNITSADSQILIGVEKTLVKAGRPAHGSVLYDI